MTMTKKLKEYQTREIRRYVQFLAEGIVAEATAPPRKLCRSANFPGLVEVTGIEPVSVLAVQ